MFLLVTDSEVMPFQYHDGALLGISSPVLPVLATMVCARSVAGFCFSVFETAIDTILLSFCEDLHLNADAHSYYMSIELQHFIDRNAVEPPSEALANGPNRSRRGQRIRSQKFKQLSTQEEGGGGEDEDAQGFVDTKDGQKEAKGKGKEGRHEKGLEQHQSWRVQADV
jgi:hypothetical protein